ncbi:c-di-GMP-binding flagellar brake protein YcgR [Desulfitispora alkaliphila]|uniref:flagellar brake protein n=1 Tax=Desulfitispora alkaliphila TaxID=622674 RepID=UPI003D1FC575
MLKKLEVNKLTEIEVVTPNGTRVYKSRVEEIGSKKITLAMPIHEGVLVSLRVGQQVNICYWDEHCYYKFDAVVKNREAEPIPIFTVELPAEKSINRIQRRNYVRVDAKVPIEYGIIPKGGEDLNKIAYYKGETIDLSGGGLRFLTKVGIKQNDLLHVNLWLENIAEALSVIGRVVRASQLSGEDQKGKLSISVEFTEIAEIERDKIVKHTFDWQRQMRRKGLL